MTGQTSLTFGRFLDLLMARLVERETEAPAGTLIDLNQVARDLKVDVPDQWVFDAGKVLESRGWAQVIFTFGGGCHARLTGEGHLYVEEERGTGIIHEYHQAPDRFVRVSGTNNQVIIGSSIGTVSQEAVTIELERAPSFRLLDQIKDVLRRDPILSDSERQDPLSSNP